MDFRRAAASAALIAETGAEPRACRNARLPRRCLGVARGEAIATHNREPTLDLAPRLLLLCARTKSPASAIGRRTYWGPISGGAPSCPREARLVARRSSGAVCRWRSSCGVGADLGVKIAWEPEAFRHGLLASLAWSIRQSVRPAPNLFDGGAVDGLQSRPPGSERSAGRRAAEVGLLPSWGVW